MAEDAHAPRRVGFDFAAYGAVATDQQREVVNVLGRADRRQRILSPLELTEEERDDLVGAEAERRSRTRTLSGRRPGWQPDAVVDDYELAQVTRCGHASEVV